MGKVFDMIITNPVYALIAALLVFLLIIGFIKQRGKILFLGFLLSAIFVGFLYYKGKNVSQIKQEVREVKTEAVKQTNKAIKDMKKQGEEVLKSMESIDDMTKSDKKDKK